MFACMKIAKHEIAVSKFFPAAKNIRFGQNSGYKFYNMSQISERLTHRVLCECNSYTHTRQTYRVQWAMDIAHAKTTAAKIVINGLIDAYILITNKAIYNTQTCSFIPFPCLLDAIFSALAFCKIYLLLILSKKPKRRSTKHEACSMTMKITYNSYWNSFSKRINDETS